MYYIFFINRRAKTRLPIRDTPPPNMTREKFDRLQQWFHKTHDIEPEVFNESKSQTFNRSTSTPYFYSINTL